MKRFLRALIPTVILIGLAAAFLKTSYVPPVLMYHAIDYNDKVTKLSVNPESFARQMDFLHKNRYNVVTLDKMAAYLKKGERIPPKTVAITFDDGFYNNYQYAYPVLKRYNIPATIFIIVGKVGEDGYCGWKEIKEMSDSGVITAGSHTISHKWLPSKSMKELEYELIGSKAAIEENVGKNVDGLCYPMGAFDERVQRHTRAAGYKYAAATNPRGYADDDVYAMRRVRISRTSDNLFVFWLEASGYYTWVKEHRDD